MPKQTGRRDSTVRRLREGLRPFLREHGERLIDSFTRDEAITWTLPKGANTQQAVRQFFNHAHDRDLIPHNHFARLGASKRKRRVERPALYDQALHEPDRQLPERASSD